MKYRFASVSTAIVALLAAAPAHALYKVVGPDGSVTYTDRQPVAAQGRVIQLGASGAPVTDNPLPPELRQIAARWPVTLFTSPDCTPCDEARRLLRERGVPHGERTVTGLEDREAWSDIVGGPESPSLRIGAQTLRGLDSAKWNDYLSAAGYPTASRLPPTYRFAPPEPLVPRRSSEARAVPGARQAATPAAAPADDAQAPPGFRF